MAGFGDVELGYAARGAAQSDGTEAVPSHSGVWGNITMPGSVDCIIRPGRMVDFPLCSFRKTISM